MDLKTLNSKIAATPKAIREWFSSEEFVAIITKIDDHFHISKEKESFIPKLLLRLEIENIEPQYFSGELAGGLSLDRDRALILSEEIRRLILQPVAKDFQAIGVDINLLKSFETSVIQKKDLEIAPGPKMLQEIAAPVPIGATGGKGQGTKEVGTGITPPNLPSERGGTAGLPPMPPTPAPMMGAGWSKIPAALVPPPIVPVPKPYTPNPSTPTLQKTEMGKIPRPGETLNIKQENSQAGTVVRPMANSGPAPMMFSDDAAVKQIQKAPDFKMVSDDKIAAASKFATPAGAGVKSAVLEFSGAKPPLPPASAPRVINYADAAPVEGRRMMEMTGGGTLNIKQENIQQRTIGVPPVPLRRDGGVMPTPAVPKPPTPPVPGH